MSTVRKLERSYARCERSVSGIVRNMERVKSLKLVVSGQSTLVRHVAKSTTVRFYRIELNPVIVRVDQLKCRAIAKVLAALRLPADREEIAISFPPRDAANLFLLVVAICHQTQRLEGEVQGVPCRGWDYLLKRLHEAAQTDRQLLSPVTWKALYGSDLTKIFGPTLQHADSRAALIRNLGDQMAARSWVSFEDTYVEARRCIAAGTPNLINLLRTFVAYDDPVNKKSFFLLGLMLNSLQWSYTDPENLGAPVDYHEVRGHLRIGTVRITDESLRAKLHSGISVTEAEDVAIRGAVSEAISLIAPRAGIATPMLLHYLFWNLFRNICTRTEPFCFDCSRVPGLPLRYRSILGSGSGVSRCLFADVCESAGHAPLLTEHSFDTHWY
jgi:hypothetical protein